MDEFTIICPHCQHELHISEEFAEKTMQCPFCFKMVTLPSGAQIKKNIPSGTLGSFLEKPIPEGYASLRAFIPIFQIIGWLHIIGGLVGGIVVAAMTDKGWPGFFVAIGFSINGIIFLAAAAFFNLFSNTTRDTAYLVALKEHELKNRD